MKSRYFLLLTVLSLAFGWSIWTTASAASAKDATAIPASTVPVAVVSLGATEGKTSVRYVGSKKCKMCHLQVHKSWSKTKMGQAFEVLKPGNAKENKQKFNIDMKKDFSRDEKCVKCHTTGYGLPGGYTIPDLADKKAVRKAKKLQGIGCENCHGPGSEYVKLHKEILKSKRPYTNDEMYAAGMNKISKKTCLKCHNQESPTIDKDYVFDYEKRKTQGIHKHQTLKYRKK